MKQIALVAASAFFTLAGIGAALAEDPYPVRSQDEAIAVERSRASGVNAIQPDPYYYGNNPGARATGPNAYDRSNDVPQHVIYGAAPPSSDIEAEAIEADKDRQDSNAEAYDRGRADQARDDADHP